MRGERNDCNCFSKLLLLPRKLPTACHCLKESKLKEQGNIASHFSDFSLVKRITELIQLHVGSHQERQYSQAPQKIALKFWVMLVFVEVCFVLFKIVQIERKTTSKNKR